MVSMTAPLPGRLLVATPLIGDPNFERTVVLLLDCGSDGALGLVLNRPSATDLLGPLPQWDRLAAHPAVVFVGGPVEQERAIALAKTSTAPFDSAVLDDAFSAVVGAVGTLDLHVDPDLVGGALDEVRIFSGYAGWGPGQLDHELEAGAWWVVAAEPADILSDQPDRLWRAVLARQPVDLARFSRFPDDPSVN
jgi:putative transcriptional regulator